MAKSTTQTKADLLSRRDAILTEVAALSSSTAGGLPNSTGPGVHIDHQGYKDSLYAELKQLDDALNRISPGVIISEVR